eukprot:2809956-Prymnesium_polylepis.1
MAQDELLVSLLDETRLEVEAEHHVCASERRGAAGLDRELDRAQALLVRKTRVCATHEEREANVT